MKIVKEKDWERVDDFNGLLAFVSRPKIGWTDPEMLLVEKARFDHLDGQSEFLKSQNSLASVLEGKCV